MKLIIGLGNPGKIYQETRHNVGFLVIEEIGKEFDGQNFRFDKKFKSKISKLKFNGQKIILAKPQTFMNDSGRAVKALINYYNILPVTNLWLIYDDIDLPFGKLRIRKSGSSAGHKGVESIIYSIGTKNFIRFRIGIRPKDKKTFNTEKYVLQNFTKKEKEILEKEVLPKAKEAIEYALKEGIDKAISFLS